MRMINKLCAGLGAATATLASLPFFWPVYEKTFQPVQSVGLILPRCTSPILVNLTMPTIPSHSGWCLPEAQRYEAIGELARNWSTIKSITDSHREILSKVEVSSIVYLVFWDHIDGSSSPLGVKQRSEFYGCKVQAPASRPFFSISAF
jgi:hypothetical protein